MVNDSSAGEGGGVPIHTKAGLYKTSLKNDAYCASKAVVLISGLILEVMCINAISSLIIPSTAKEAAVTAC